MKEFFKQIFEDNSGGFSMQRSGTAVCLVMFVIVTVIILKIAMTVQPIIIQEATVIPADTKVLDVLIYLDLGILALGLGIKAVQRFGERESNIEAKPTEQKQPVTI